MITLQFHIYTRMSGLRACAVGWSPSSHALTERVWLGQAIQREDGDGECTTSLDGGCAVSHSSDPRSPLQYSMRSRHQWSVKILLAKKGGGADFRLVDVHCS